MNAVRAIVVREALPPTRYRGPAVFVILALATVLSVIGSLTVAGELLSFEAGGAISIVASLVILTITQAGLVAAAIMFVAVPNALAGVRLMPASGALRTYALGLGLAIPTWVAATLTGALVQMVLDMLGRPAEPGLVEEAVSRLDPTVLVLAIVLVAPIAEEIFFRGVVFNAWMREHGVRVAIIGSALLFAAIHADPSSGETLVASIARVVPIFGLGLGLAFVYWRTGSLLAPIGLHMGFNAISLAITFVQRLGGLPSF
jgi:membrane protease YdiL (CAAX protease family)